MKKIVNLLIVVGFIGLVIYLWLNKPESQVVTNIETKTDTVFIPDTIERTVYQPRYITKVETKWKDKKVDTAAILQAYYNKNYYQDTLVNDSALFVEVRDTVTQNKVYSRDFTIIRNYPIVTKQTTITNTIERNELFIGIYAGQGVGGQVHYNFKKHMIGGQLGTNGVFVSYSYKIGE